MNVMNVETAINKVKGHIDRLFDKNLTDLIRGIRNNRENESKYISQCIDEIKMELKQDNLAIKANAVAKLTYLQMIGYNINWAAFNIIEVMSSNKFTYKRIGYLAAAQSFHPTTDVLMLTTNMIKKDINSSNQYEAAISLGGLACFITPDLARDLSNDIISLMSSTKPYLRKRAILMMYKIFVNYPDALENGFSKMKDKLEDQDQSVQSAAVNVICELARRNPKNYLSLAPIFFKLMTNSTNNWMLIKIIKLFGTLTPLEPRLGKKLMEPLTNLIHSTSAMSLLYECINTLLAVLVSISSGQPNHSSSIQLCLQKLRILIEDSDQNLKYLGLLAMGKILKTYPKNVQAHKDIVLRCLDDKDDSIRLRALHLLYGMVNKKNLVDIVKTLLNHLCTADCVQSYKDELMANVVNVCSQNNYQYVTDFEWYLGVLVELTKVDTPKNAPLIASQLLDVTIRVPSLREHSVHQMENLLDNSHLFSPKGPNRRMSEILYVAAFVCGEYSEFLRNSELTLQNLLDPRVLSLPANVQSVFLINGLKVYGRLLVTWLGQGRAGTEPSGGRSDFAEAEGKAFDLALDTGAVVIEKLGPFCQSNHVEVQERASETRHLVEIICKNKRDCLSSQIVLGLFEGELRPVAPKAQKKVPLPPGLDLDEPINDNFNDATSSVSSLASKTANGANHRSADIFGLAASSSQRYQLEDDYLDQDGGSGSDHHSTERGKKTKSKPSRHERNKRNDSGEVTKEQVDRARLARMEEQANNPHYLKSGPSVSDSRKSGQQRHKGDEESYLAVLEIPIENLDLDKPLRTEGDGAGDFDINALIANSGRKGRKKMDVEQNGVAPFGQDGYQLDGPLPAPSISHVVEILEAEMPEDALSSSPAPSDEERDFRVSSRSGKSRDRPAVKPKSTPAPEPERVPPISDEKEKGSKKDGKERRKKKHKEDREKGTNPKKGSHRKPRDRTKVSESLLDTGDVVADDRGPLILGLGEPSGRNELMNGFGQQLSAAPLKEPFLKCAPNGAGGELDDLDFWLSPTSHEAPTEVPATNGVTREPTVDHQHKKHHKKSKHKSSKSPKSRSTTTHNPDDTTSHPRPATDAPKKVDPGPRNSKVPVALPLARDDFIQMTYTTKIQPSTIRQMVMDISIENVSPRCQLKNVELTLLESGGASLSLLSPPFLIGTAANFGASNAVSTSTCTRVAACLESADAPVRLGLVFGSTYDTAPSAQMPQLRLRGCLSYLATDPAEGTSTCEKLDFKTTLPIHALMSPVPISSSEFVDLLASSSRPLRCSRDFTTSLASSSTTRAQPDTLVDQVLDLMSFKFPFYVVERLGNTAASLFSKTVLDQPVCLLLKFRWPAAQVNVVAKCDSQEVIDTLLSGELQPFLQNHFGNATEV